MGLLFWFLIHTIYCITDGLHDTKQKADVAVILGTKVNEDGTLSDRLVKRLECGLNLYRNGRVKRIIVSGGLGKEGFYEGDKMKVFLLQHQVPDSCILVDNVGNNTRLTIQNTLTLKSQYPFNSLIVVSQYFHVTRTKMLFRKAGFKNVISASPYYFEWLDLYSACREFVAYYVQLWE